MFGFRKKPNELSISVKIKLDPFQKIYKRNYIKIDESLASILSVYSIVSFVFQFFLNILEHGTMDTYLMKKLYYFFPNTKVLNSLKESNSKNKNKVKKQSIFFKLKSRETVSKQQEEEIIVSNSPKEKLSNRNLIVNNLISENDNIKDDINDKITKKSTKINMNERRLRLIFQGDPPKYRSLELFFLDLFPCKIFKFEKNIEKIIIGRNYLINDLNIINILKRLLEFEKMKQVIFDEKQLEFFKVCYFRKIDTNNLNLSEKNFQNSLKKLKFIPKNFENISSIYEEYRCSNNPMENRLAESFNLF